MMVLFYGSAFIMEKVFQYFHLLPVLKKDFVIGIYPLWKLWFLHAKSISYGFDGVMLLSALFVFLINLLVLAPVTYYFYRKSLEIIGEVGE